MCTERAIAEYHEAYRWILSLVKDPSGRIELQVKTRESRIARYRERYSRMRAFLDFAGNPEADYRSVHVAGTSGKGSVTVMTAALLTACGQVTGDHTSPFLQLPAEKLRC